MKKTYILISLAGTLCLSACSNLLDVKPYSSITEQTYFTNESDFEPYLVGIYTSMRTFANMDVYGSHRADEYVNGNNSRLNAAAYMHVLSETNGAVDWQQWYTAIGNCNLLLSKIENFTFANPDTKQRIQAETYALRAYFYFHLTRIFGDVPLMLQAVLDDNVPHLARASQSDVLQQIHADLDKALAHYAAINAASRKDYTSSKYRFNYGSVHALRADTKMWSAKVLKGGKPDFDEAIRSVTEVEASGVSLNPNFADVIAKRASTNSEHILSAYFSRDEGALNFTQNLFALTSTIAGALNLDSIVSAVSPSYAQSGYMMSPTAKDWFAEKEDKRIPYTVVTERRASGLTQNHWVVKYPGTKYADDRVPDNDLPIYRLADLLLLKAEAYAANGDFANAKLYLDKVKQRAGTKAYSGGSTKEEMNQAILAERGRELFAENKRWYDLLRFHADGTVNVYELLPNLQGKTTPLFWPISISILGKNDNLTQTSGY